MIINVPICNSCGKPHFGREKAEDRCLCDSCGNWQRGQIEEELLPPTKQPNDN